MGAMFTGIVSGVGRIVEARPLGAGAGFGKALSIEAPAGFLAGVRIGDSISLSGACMTVVSFDAAANRFAVEISAESLARTAGLDGPGEVNLETALRADDAARRPSRQRPRRRRRPRHALRAGRRIVGDAGRRAARAGALPCRSGLGRGRRRQPDDQPASPTRPEACEIGINLIQHTVANTSLRGLKRSAAPLNLEIDLIARYVERMLGAAARSSPAQEPR